VPVLLAISADFANFLTVREMILKFQCSSGTLLYRTKPARPGHAAYCVARLLCGMNLEHLAEVDPRS